jgi:phosphohistidine swiveling domain-containing protein
MNQSVEVDHMQRSKRVEQPSFIRWFDELRIEDVPLVGGKNASLGELYRLLAANGIRSPEGFAVTAEAYRLFLSENGLDVEIRRILEGLDTRDVEDLRKRGRRIRQAILAGRFAESLERGIRDAYDRLNRGSTEPVDVAVRSSATAEDLPQASFAGQQETYLNVQGHGPLIESCRRCYASLFTDRAISYRAERGFDHLQVALSIGVQRMVRSDLGAAGVMFSIDTETGFSNAVLINAAYGLGENVVQGSVTPDEYYVFKPTLKSGFRPILQKIIGSKEMKLIYDIGGSKGVKNVPVPPDDRARFAINDDDILTLARWACLIEDHYSEKLGRFAPMDMEWAKDGRNGELFILQARPETVHSQRRRDVLESFRLRERGRVLVTGRSVGDRIGQGPAHVIRNVQQLAEFRDGEVLVTDKTDPDWEPIMKKAAAIVTNRGGRTCHAAIVSRELGLPAIVGTENGTEALADGAEITLSCAEGDAGYVYAGKLAFDVERIELAAIERPRTKILMNVGTPQEVFALGRFSHFGGLLRGAAVERTFHRRLHGLKLGQTRIPLYIVVWNIDHNRVEYVGTKNTPRLSIARAARIAISIPLFVEPVRYRGDLYGDGGVVSIFPARPLLEFEEPLDLVIGVNCYYRENFDGHDVTGWRNQPWAIMRASGQLRSAIHLELAREQMCLLGPRLKMLHPVPHTEVRGTKFYESFLDRSRWPAYMRSGYHAARRLLGLKNEYSLAPKRSAAIDRRGLDDRRHFMQHVCRAERFRPSFPRTFPSR